MTSRTMESLKTEDLYTEIKKTRHILLTNHIIPKKTEKLIKLLLSGVDEQILLFETEFF